ncbi:MAG: DUF6687 family protein [Pyrinomonadaceae bacterium]
MRFEYYTDKLRDVPKLSVDGTVPNSIHFSHWQGNTTDASVKADTSTEIALNLIASSRREELTEGVELVTNNHFDTDGVLSVWAMIMGERADDLRERLIAAAVAGDFSEYTGEDGVRASICIQGSDNPLAANEETGSPLARRLAGESVEDDARAYDLVLPEVERVLTRTSDYEALWRPAWERIAAALESFARGRSKVKEDMDAQLSVVTLAPEIFSPQGFDATRHCAPYTAISHHARGQIYLIATPSGSGWSYRIDYPYYSWAETVVRPRIERRDLSALVARLNELERSAQGRWKIDTSELSSALKFMDETNALAPSSLAPERVSEETRAALLETRASVIGV